MEEIESGRGLDFSINQKYSRVRSETLKDRIQYFESVQIEPSCKKSNFFETRVSEYSKAGVGDTEDDRKFELDADF